MLSDMQKKHWWNTLLPEAKQNLDLKYLLVSFTKTTSRPQSHQQPWVAMHAGSKEH